MANTNDKFLPDVDDDNRDFYVFTILKTNVERGLTDLKVHKWDMMSLSCNDEDKVMWLVVPPINISSETTIKIIKDFSDNWLHSYFIDEQWKVSF